MDSACYCLWIISGVWDRRMVSPCGCVVQNEIHEHDVHELR